MYLKNNNYQLYPDNQAEILEFPTAVNDISLL